ncbi:MAG: STAS domain-containing protein [Candidatus Peregrinibacteria bacterium]|nr:STAS domain-containing protein [Candidatus Peregrinibacteria bacterium]
MQKLTVSIGDLPGVPNAQLVKFVGDFDGYAKESITGVESAVNEATAGSSFVFDFSGLNYLNSFAIGQLVSWHNSLESKQGRILIVGTNKNVEDIFSVLGINTIFKNFATLEEAKKELT